MFGADTLEKTFEDFRIHFTNENKIDIFKVSHHGSINAMSKNLIEKNYINEETKYIILPFIHHNLPDDDFLRLLKGKEVYCSSILEKQVKPLNPLKEVAKKHMEKDKKIKYKSKIDNKQQSGIIQVEITKNGETSINLHGDAIKL